MNRFNEGDVVTVRKESEPARIVSVVFDDEADIYWYEIKAINLEGVPNREVKEADLRMARRIVDVEEGPWRYFDKDWKELHNGDILQQPDGTREVLYLTEQGRLGVDATNKKWIESGRAVPCQYGIYPLTHDDVMYGCKVERDAS